VEIGDLHVEVVDVDRRRIGKVRLTRREDVKTVEGERTT
jgi:CBS domain containing-hemolysin-like protein